MHLCFLEIFELLKKKIECISYFDKLLSIGKSAFIEIGRGVEDMLNILCNCLIGRSCLCGLLSVESEGSDVRHA